MNPYEMFFNFNLSLWQRILLVFGWHVQVRVCGPVIQWGITRKPLTDIDRDCYARFNVQATIVS